MKHPNVGDVATIRFAGMTKTGVVVEVNGTGKDKRWVVKSGGIFYPCLTLDSSKLNYIIKCIYNDIDTT